MHLFSADVIYFTVLINLVETVFLSLKLINMVNHLINS